MQGTQRVVSRHALILMGRGNTEIAAQIFVYDHMREIRVDLENLEVKVLMDYDKDYFRVFKVEVNENLTKEAAQKIVLDFYNNLLNASMKLSEEEKQNLAAQRQAQVEKTQKAMAEKVAPEANKEVVIEEPTTEDSEEVAVEQTEE